jgi:alpha-1,2-glucosyltransferase
VYFQLTGKCDTNTLRSLNQALIPVIAFMCFIILGFLGPTSEKDLNQLSGDRLRRRVHTAFNVSLFPPLFFFSALYYTDVASTLFVLFAFSAYQSSIEEGLGSRSALRIIVCGVTSLLFRQTNVFWAAVFPAALAVIGRAKQLGCVWPPTPLSTPPGLDQIVIRAWSESRIYDPPVSDAEVEGGLYTFVALRNS